MKVILFRIGKLLCLVAVGYEMFGILPKQSIFLQQHQHQEQHEQQQILHGTDPMITSFHMEINQPEQRKQLATTTTGVQLKRNVSVVIMNHARPGFLLQSNLLSTFLLHPAINDVILCHSNAQTQFNNTHILEQIQLQQVTEKSSSIAQQQQQQQQQKRHPLSSVTEELLHSKLRHMDAIAVNEKLGLALRFHFCSHTAQNQWVIIVDDDMEISSTAIDKLITAMEANSKRIVGYYGRIYNYYTNPITYGYDRTTFSGRTVEVVLTKLLIVERTICSEFFQYAYLVESEFVRPLSKPLWNGEDIFLNLVANHYYHVPPNGPYNSFAMKNRNNHVGNVYNNDHKELVWEANPQLLKLKYHSQQAVTPSAYNNNNNNDNKIDTTSTGNGMLTPALDELNKRLHNPTAESNTSNKSIRRSSTSISGDRDAASIWKTGFSGYYKSMERAVKHLRYRGRLWYVAKQRLIATRSAKGAGVQ